MWGESIWTRLERERRMKQQHPELQLASPDRVMQADNHRIQNKGGFISTFSQMAMALAKRAAEEQQLRRLDQPVDMNVGAQPQKRAGVPLGVAQAFPEEAQGRRVYDVAQGGGGGTSGALDVLKGPAINQPLLDLPGAPGPIRGAVQEVSRPRTWMEMALAAPVAGAAESAGIGGRIVSALLTPMGAQAGIGRNVIATAGMNLGAKVGADVANRLTPDNAPGAVQVGAGIAGGLIGGGLGLGAAGAATREGTLQGLKGAATGYRDLTKNIPVGAGIKDISGGGLQPGDRVRAADRNNIGKIVGIIGDYANVQFYNRKTGANATVSIHMSQLSPLRSARKAAPKAAENAAKSAGPSSDALRNAAKSATGDIRQTAEDMRVGDQLKAVEEQVRQEGGWTADTIKQWQELTGKRPTASMTRPIESITPPGEVGSRTPEDIIQGAGNAIVKNAGAADTNLRNDLPLLHVLDAVENLKSLQGARNEMVGQLRSRQAGALRGTLENVQGQGMEGLRKVSAARRGAADAPSYTPLKELLGQDTIDSVANHLAERGLDHPPFAVGTAMDAWSNMVDGKWVTPSQIKTFGDVAGLNEQQVKQLTGLISKAGGIEKDSIWDAIKSDPVRAANNTIRASRLWTLLDVSYIGRLAPTAGLYDMRSYARATGQAFRSLKSPGVVEDVLKNVDQRALDTGFLPDTQLMHEVGLRFHSSELNDQSPGLLGKLPLLGRGAKLDQVFTGLFRPQAMQTTVENMVKAGKITEEQAKDPAILNEIARGINNIGGASNIIKGEGSAAEHFISFPNWYASQFELVASAFQAGSISHQMARQTLTKLTLLMTAATVAGNVAQGKNPADYIKDGVPQLAIGNDGLTVDLYGPIGELIRHAIRTGRAGYEGATPNGPQGGIDIPRGAGAAGHELAGWGRSMLSPLIGIATDLMLGKDFVGTKVRDTQQHTMEYLGRSVAPFAASNLLDLGEKGSGFTSLNDRGLLAGTLSELGFRGVHVPSEGAKLYGKLDDLAQAMHVQDEQGNEIKTYGDLPPGAKQAIKDAHPDLSEAIDNYGLKKGEEQGRAVQVKQELQSRQAADDKLLEQNPGYAAQWRNNTNDRQTELALRKNEIYQGVDFTKGQWPVLDAYFNEIKKATGANGVVDWDAVDSYRASLTDTQNAFIDDNTGLSSLSPVVKQYRADRKTIEQSGYWDVREQAFGVFAPAVGAKSGVKSQDYFADLPKEYLKQAQQYLDQSSPSWRATAPGADFMMAQAISDRVGQRFNQILGAYHQQFLFQHPDVYALLAKWGYRDPSAALTGAYAGMGQ